MKRQYHSPACHIVTFIPDTYFICQSPTGENVSAAHDQMKIEGEAQYSNGKHFFPNLWEAQE